MKTVVIGSGSWGTGLGQVLCDNGREVIIYGNCKEQIDDIEQNHRNAMFFEDVQLNPDLHATMDVNVVGAFNCSKRVYRHMLDQEYGRIINISSTNGINTYYPMCIDYDASKAALISVTHNLAFEFAPYIHVNCIAPGFIGTENELDGYDEEFLKEEEEKIMVKRYGKPEEVAYLVRFLISDEADYINNTVIRIDGGQQGSC